MRLIPFIFVCLVSLSACAGSGKPDSQNPSATASTATIETTSADPLVVYLEVQG